MIRELILKKRLLLVLAILLICGYFAFAEAVSNIEAPDSGLPWWMYPILLFVVTLLIGILAALSGVGGGVLFVPIVSSFFPFHFDFVRGAGLFIAMAMALSASPRLLKQGLANLRLTLPIALITSIGAIIGAMVGLSLPTQIIQMALGVLILAIVVFMLLAKKSDFPKVDKPDRLSQFLGIGGFYFEHSHGKNIPWSVHRIVPAFFLFFGIGLASGIFGLGAGWANVPTLNLVLGLPLKMAVGTSVFLMSITSTAAGWVYLNEGAILSVMLIPAIAGSMIGSKIGSRLLMVAHPKIVRYIVLAVLALAGIRSLLKGFGI